MKNPDNYVNIRNVTGCGRKRGLQLVLDSQTMASILPKKYLAKGFKVFVTIPGVVTSKVSFLADPTFQGEHNFFIHGIHVVKVRLYTCQFFAHFIFCQKKQKKICKK